MELTGRYSKPVYQGSRIRKTVEMVEKLAKTQVREPVLVPQEHRVDRRLSAKMIAELVKAYRNGVGTPELRRRYELSQGSVIKILHEHGVQMRNQGLTEGHTAMAAELYRDGASLAQLAEHFAVSPNAARRALLAAGVVMRARGGRRPRRGH